MSRFSHLTPSQPSNWAQPIKNPRLTQPSLKPLQRRTLCLLHAHDGAAATPLCQSPRTPVRLALSPHPPVPRPPVPCPHVRRAATPRSRPSSRPPQRLVLWRMANSVGCSSEPLPSASVDNGQHAFFCWLLLACLYVPICNTKRSGAHLLNLLKL